jgi:hypothetical protein
MGGRPHVAKRGGIRVFPGARMQIHRDAVAFCSRRTFKMAKTKKSPACKLGVSHSKYDLQGEHDADYK